MRRCLAWWFNACAEVEKMTMLKFISGFVLAILICLPLTGHSGPDLKGAPD